MLFFIFIALFAISVLAVIHTDEIADRAFQLALMFVQTRAIAERGRKPSGYEFGKLLEETEYNYKIEEANDDEA
jgi:hypothetical protein